MRLVTVAHGTRDPAGAATAAALTRLAGERLGMIATASYLEVSEPPFPDVLLESEEAAVVVPLLLSTGYHVRNDIPLVLDKAIGPVAVSGRMGPDRRLAVAQVDRLRQAGAEPGKPVVMVAAGSSDPEAITDLETAADHLSRLWGHPVRLATLSGSGPSVEEVIEPGDAVSTYLLAEGHFATQTAVRSTAAGAELVAAPLGCHAAVVDLVVARATRALVCRPISDSGH